MALGDILTFLGYFIAPILTVFVLALFIHCVLTLHRSSESHLFRFDSILITVTPQSHRPQFQHAIADGDLV